MAKTPLNFAGDQFVIDQLCARVEDAVVTARASTGDVTIRAYMDEDGERQFCIERIGIELLKGLFAEDAVAALQAMA